MMKIREILKKIIPHGIVMHRNKNRFLEDYDEWKAQGGSIVFDHTCIFDSFVTIDGFGSSGSSAVMDLMREYDGCMVWATKPSFTDSGDDVTAMGEMDLVRFHGGLLYLEKMIDEDSVVNVFWATEAVKSFMAMAFHSAQYKLHPELRPLFFGFLDRIVDQRLTSDKQLMGAYNNPFSAIKDIFYLRRMNKEEYYTICREFLYTLFNRLFPEAKGGCLVLDHIFDDCGLDMQHFQKYLPGIKRIKVRRDIRGVYVDAVGHDHRWLAHDTVDEFVKWERRVYYGHNDDNPDFLTVRFETLVENYDRELRRIEDYLQLSPSQHVKPKQYFNPQLSGRNIRIWSKHPELSYEIQQIARMAPDLCYVQASQAKL